MIVEKKRRLGGVISLMQIPSSDDTLTNRPRIPKAAGTFFSDSIREKN